MKNCLIFGPGQITKKEISAALQEAGDSAFVVAVDGGLNHILQNNLDVHLWVGDADSVDPKKLKKISCTKIPLKKTKDYSDFEYALHLLGKEFLSNLWSGNVVLIGFQGARLDHEQIGLMVVHTWVKDLISAGVPKSLLPKVISFGRDGMLVCFGHSLELFLTKEHVFSLFGFEKLKLSISGAKYNCKKKEFVHASTGLSNLGLGKEVKVTSHTKNPVLMWITILS